MINELLMLGIACIVFIALASIFKIVAAKIGLDPDSVRIGMIVLGAIALILFLIFCVRLLLWML